MALFGHAEKRNLHGLVCVPVMPKSLASKYLTLLIELTKLPLKSLNPHTSFTFMTSVNRINISLLLYPSIYSLQ